jgi:hypothetical protein
MKTLSSQELRIGNYVEYGGVINKVYLVSHIYFQVESTDIPTFTANKNRAAEPIPLTEEWLFKFGFKKHHKHGYFYIENFTIDVDMNGQFFMCDVDIHVVLKYVHQLQNLYFAFTSEELTLEP